MSTGLLDYMAQAHPDGKVTVACGWLPAPLFEGFPNVEAVIPMKKEKRSGHWIKLWKQVIGTRWDIVVDLRNSVVSRLIFTKKRYIFGPRIDRSKHKVEQGAQVMALESVPAPRLYFSDEQKAFAEQMIPKGCAVIGVGPSANWIGKTWPAERFIKVLEWMRGDDGIFPGARIAVFAAPGEEEQAHPVLEAFPRSAQIDCIAKGNPGQAAAAIARCDFYIGNDSGLMHCAAASGVPTVGVFGPSYPHLYAPWGEHTAYARTPETFDQLIDFEGYDPKTLNRSLMLSLPVKSVITEINEFYKRRLAA